mmetsp:Transcript_3416/g.6514  ORF Transcript_3416/g.6514 Transcript_3416/m.6514 type:complete len:534 (-) Transcript_3416:400-2001(-)
MMGFSSGTSMASSAASTAKDMLFDRAERGDVIGERGELTGERTGGEPMLLEKPRMSMEHCWELARPRVAPDFLAVRSIASRWIPRLRSFRFRSGCCVATSISSSTSMYPLPSKSILPWMFWSCSCSIARRVLLLLPCSVFAEDRARLMRRACSRSMRLASPARRASSSSLVRRPSPSSSMSWTSSSNSLVIMRSGVPVGRPEIADSSGSGAAPTSHSSLRLRWRSFVSWTIPRVRSQGLVFRSICSFSCSSSRLATIFWYFTCIRSTNASSRCCCAIISGKLGLARVAASRSRWALLRAFFACAPALSWCLTWEAFTVWALAWWASMFCSCSSECSLSFFFHGAGSFNFRGAPERSGAKVGWFLGADLGLSAAGFFIMGGWGTSFEGANLNTRSSSSLGASCVGLLRDPSTSSVRARMVLSPKVSASNEVSRFSVPNSRMCLRRNASFWFHCRSSSARSYIRRPLAASAMSIHVCEAAEIFSIALLMALSATVSSWDRGRGGAVACAAGCTALASCSAACATCSCASWACWLS